MRNVRKYLGISVALLAVASFFLLGSAPAMAQPRPMAEDVYTPISKGYDLMRDGKYEAAQFEFETALKRDRYNPFALNNLAALMEKQGKMKEALAFLTDAQTNAKDYFDKVDQTCFVGGLCAGVKPVKIVGPTSTIAPIIAENMKKLQEKMAASPAKPEPSTPPPMEKKK
jgi:tetratricopeptide (TPR) repeat protein